MSYNKCIIKVEFCIMCCIYFSSKTVVGQVIRYVRTDRTLPLISFGKTLTISSEIAPSCFSPWILQLYPNWYVESHERSKESRLVFYILMSHYLCQWLCTCEFLHYCWHRALCHSPTVYIFYWFLALIHIFEYTLVLLKLKNPSFFLGENILTALSKFSCNGWK